MNNQLENIIKYLGNEMPENERLEFEDQISKDKSLAKEVLFQRGLHGFLQREKPELEQKLKNLGNEFIINQETKKRFFPYWIGLLILIIGLLIGYLFLFSNNSIQEDSQNSIEKKEDIPFNEEEEKEPQKNIEEPIKEEIEDSKNNPPKKEEKPEEIIPENQPIASLNEKDYKRNPMMEEVITETYRTNEEEDFTIVTIPEEDAIFEYSKEILFVLNGSSSIHDNCQLIIYSNRDFDIENDHRILDAKIDGERINDHYQFDFKANLSLEKGLYYLIIRKEGTRDVLHISRFTVE